MKRSMKSKRVSWAPGVNLCQVALFKKDDPASSVGLKHVQIHTSCNSYADGLQPNCLPPGFGCSTLQVSHVPAVKWSSPPKFAVNPNWRVAASEESQEVGAQLLRESKELESVYPRSSSIPSSPSVSLEAQAERFNDNLTPVIPIIPIEEVETVDPQLHLKLPPCAPEARQISEPETRKRVPPPTEKTSPPKLTVVATAGTDAAAAAASAALTVLLKSTERGSMIDTNLLIKILSDPKMVEKLMKNSAGSFSLPKLNPTVSLPVPDIKAPKLDMPQAPSGRKLDIPSYGSDLIKTAHAPGLVSVPIPVTAHANGQVPFSRSAVPFTKTNPMNLTPVVAPIPAPVSSAEAAKPQPVKGIDYYKNLIRQHGVETQQDMVQINGIQNPLDNSISDHQKLKPMEMTPKRQHQQKHCMFYNSPQGCRRGSNCPFQHGPILPQWRTGTLMDEPSAKRMRLGDEIMGR
ncbi:zinc finger CCCH domain-containing protein 30-like [Punica granatum]|uniref:Zinc finger CCCH domain-containing protein 30-like n=1 Tax=Punica granatum TaxID=22663 RepID=A0A6P8E9C4_PUNGR|nr:zinc finger CCCH domain-containing protein 30-like [Punica granatum]